MHINMTLQKKSIYIYYILKLIMYIKKLLSLACYRLYDLCSCFKLIETEIYEDNLWYPICKNTFINKSWIILMNVAFSKTCNMIYLLEMPIVFWLFCVKYDFIGGSFIQI